ncbi:EVE domain-containing protein [Pseudooceanicola lipolyticus]|uniref:UPF0310 protein CVM52_18600 n=1 Tax=Pseudooceanicola lipolyticus TaxID=2029104 RepID=A0A2M8IX82_9RHOB|nr:EVE domain-containing protein [Pseudooceanicola lipolyticus]PJE35141.1 EVE domain-containing protein [Pseudooceanicola lipolyticus]
MTHWIGVAHRKHALIGRAQGFCAFSHGKEAAVRRLSPGDLFVYYAPREDFDGPAVQAFVALGQVAEGDPAPMAMPGTDFTPFARPARYEAVAELPVRPLLDELSFVRSPRHWGMAFRRALFEVSAEDFARIATPMRAGA